MRALEAAEKALGLVAKRGLPRDAFGKPIAKLGKNVEVIAQARIEIEAMRMMILKGGESNGCPWQRRRPNWDQRYQSNGPPTRVPHHRRGDSAP